MSAFLSFTPITTRSGFIKSLTADPSAKNSGLLTTMYLFLFYGIVFEFIIFVIIFAVPIGTVDFYTTNTLFSILSGCWL